MSLDESSLRTGGIVISKAFSLAFLVGGVALIVTGINASQSFGSDISRFFTGNPTDKSVWMLVGGVVLFIVGLSGWLRSSKTTSLKETYRALLRRDLPPCCHHGWRLGVHRNCRHCGLDRQSFVRHFPGTVCGFITARQTAGVVTVERVFTSYAS